MAYSKIRPRRDTLEQWLAINPVLTEGEFVIESPETGVGTGLIKVKIGDGLKRYKDLPYAFDGTAANAIYGGDVYEWHDICIRTGNSDEWNDVDPVLGMGEITFDSSEGRFKVGDGVHKWSELRYIGGIDMEDPLEYEETNEYDSKTEDEVMNILKPGSSLQMILNAVKSLLKKKAPKNHASTTTDYGKGTTDKFGHLKISDEIDGTNGASEGVAASEKAVGSLKTELETKITDVEGNIGSHTHDEYASKNHSHNNYASKSIYNDYVVNLGRKQDSTSGAMSVTAGRNVVASGDYSHAEGEDTVASGKHSHAEGYQTLASGYQSHAEGYHTCAVNTDFNYRSSHAEGYQTLASGTYGSHAEGRTTKATGEASHAEGYDTTSGVGSHAEGFSSIADGHSHAEGCATSAVTISHAEGNYTTASNGSHVEGSFSLASGQISHAEGQLTTASGKASHAEGYQTIASANYSHVEGYQTSTHDSSVYSHAEGYQTSTFCDAAHAEGDRTYANGPNSHAEGSQTLASGSAAHAEGSQTCAIGYYSHAEGHQTTADGLSSHVEGNSSLASGQYSHAEGNFTSATGFYTHAEGNNTIADFTESHAEGFYNIPTSTGNKLHVVGNGTSSSRHNAFSINWNGTAFLAGTLTQSTTADYAEYFEWEDGNPTFEDRVGHFVTFSDEDKIRIANSNDDYILGIVSGQPAVLANGDCDVWNGMILRDKFNREIYERDIKKEFNKETGELEDVLDANGDPVYYGMRPVINPNYDPNEPYVPRSDRPEWSPIGMLGVLSVYQDGSCTINGYCKCNDNGIATRCDNPKEGYRVIKVIDEEIVKIVFNMH